MAVLFETWYRQFGVRRSNQLVQPPLPGMDRLILPRRSLFHYPGTGPLDDGPDATQLEFRGITRPILVHHVVRQSVNLGNPRPLPTPVATLASRFFQKKRRYKKLVNFETATRDDNTLCVFNYAFLWRTYRYARSIYAGTWQWHNINETLWMQVTEVASRSNRNQFIPVALPAVLPCLTDLKLGEMGQPMGQMSQRLVKRFAAHESLMILEIWKWLGENRKASMISHVPDDRLSRVNLILEESGRWFVVNLGTLNGWRVATKEELEANPEANRHGFEPNRIQRYFLRMLMTLMEVRTAAAPEVSAQSGAAREPSAAPPEEPVNVVDETSAEAGPAGAHFGDQVTRTVQQPQQLPDSPAFHATHPRQAHDDQEDEREEDNARVGRVAARLAVAQHEPDERGVDIHPDEELEQQIEADLQQLEHIAGLTFSDEDTTAGPAAPAETAAPAGPLAPEDAVMKIADRLAAQGMMSAGEHRRYQTLSQAYKKIVAPDGRSTLSAFVQIPPGDVHIAESPAITDIPTVLDKTMLRSSLLTFDPKYIRTVMQKDIAGMVLNLQHAGLCVTGYDVEDVDDVMGAYRIHTARVVPIEGAASTLRFRLPVVDEDGTFTSNGVKYRMRKQKGDLPIRKIAPGRVALTSYYGKVFVSRSTKRVNDYATWLTNAIMAAGLDPHAGLVTQMHTAPVFDNLFACPRLYSTLATSFRSFQLAGFEWNFDHTRRETLYGTDTLRRYEQHGEHEGAIVCGQSLTDPAALAVMDQHGALREVREGKEQPLPTFEAMLQLDATKAPVDFAEVMVLGRAIPLGLVLGYEMGLEPLMKLLRVTPRRVPAGQRVSLQPEEYALVFADETLVFPKANTFASMVLAGFNEYHRSIRTFNVHEFDRRGVYLNVLESGGQSQRYLREIDLQYQLFVDPITRELLVDMKEPTDYQGLLLRACAMLLADHHPDELDSAWMRIKGYERMAGAVYSEIVRSIRVHHGRPGRNRLPIDLNPFQVWKNVTQDPAKLQISEINPIQNIKEMEAVTYSGVGGRGARSMVKHTRAYHRNDMGTISEATTDSSDVGVNTYTSADPQFTSLRGISRRYETGRTGATALFSTSALLAPAADRDDPKRVNFISIQGSHKIACRGYHQPALRTGYEQVIAHRTGDMFAVTAKKPGRVISVGPEGMKVQYEDGETQGIELGRRFGNAAGLVVPHQIRTQMRAGQTFSPGDVIAWNEGFFEPDILNPANVVMKTGVSIKTVFMENPMTLEDSSVISKETAALLMTKQTRVRTIVINFDQEVHKLRKVGDEVGSDDILCVIEDAVTAGNRLFDEASLDTLRVLSAQTPQAKAKGVIERVDVFYHGEVEDMSPTLAKIVATTDAQMIRRARATGRKAFTGSVDEAFRVEGNPLQLDTAAIQIYITSDVPAGVGDKGVFGNQLKTVFGEVMERDMFTESGVKIGAVFGAKSVADRIVSSPELIGTTTTVLDVIAMAAVDLYRS
ncbi:hypothetical protein HDG34_003235 [Paraburkholderia sp. HC6.4b]|uniref:hypothetical protein n=1 Tax=unclassified Paraburkholderia TaxID=2615204 RepID=UPI0016071E5B|nr:MULTISPECIES: hypothetical protein [unclassified Paraburkholderia]MBB5409294.1 hypothetical protein [Paraburkholderia sp. HC6.4b]MBB5451022.1 hypothetical protein [Paraburkholderia sp. Kb1A]